MSPDDEIFPQTIKSYRQLAKELGITHQSLYRYRDRHGEGMVIERCIRAGINPYITDTMTLIRDPDPSTHKDPPQEKPTYTPPIPEGECIRIRKDHSSLILKELEACRKKVYEFVSRPPQDKYEESRQASIAVQYFRIIMTTKNPK